MSDSLPIKLANKYLAIAYGKRPIQDFQRRQLMQAHVSGAIFGASNFTTSLCDLGVDPTSDQVQAVLDGMKPRMVEEFATYARMVFRDEIGPEQRKHLSAAFVCGGESAVTAVYLMSTRLSDEDAEMALKVFLQECRDEARAIALGLFLTEKKTGTDG